MEEEMATGMTKGKSTDLSPEDVSVKVTGCATGTGASPKVAQTPPTEDSTAAPGVVDNLYFYEDEIFRIDKKGNVKFGLIIETSETYSGDEDDDYDDVLNKGEVRVAWYPEGKEHVQPEKTIGLADRTLMPGDVVRRLVQGNIAQRGYCREINTRADVKVLGTKFVIKNVHGERLRLIANWPRDSAVCLDSWVGSTKDIEEKAVLRSSSGSRIEVSSSDFYAFKDANSRYASGIFNPRAFYPGNVVTGHLNSVDSVKMLTEGSPFPTNKKGKPLSGKFTIESIYTDSVWVHWQYKALSDDAKLQCGALQQPNPCVNGEDLKHLKRLNLFEPCMLQINDRNYLTFSQHDQIVKKSVWEKEQAAKFKLVFNEQHKEENRHSNVHASDSASKANTTATSNHHFDKIKKKFSLMETGKSKKFLLKEKLTSSTSKEKFQKYENLSKVTSTSAATDGGWVSDDDVEGDSGGHSKDEYSLAGAVAVHSSNKDSMSTTTTLSTCSSPSPRTSPKSVNRRQLKKKASKTLRNTLCPVGLASGLVPKDGEELVTEALLVYSSATVVWQDGTVENNIPSTQLYPIHHLDNHEFFPGDFVISAKDESDTTFRDYGVIQNVDHLGRTARVKWFTTYTSTDKPSPTYKGETEVSVYDLKDHPDFQYHPGTIVIRVANFVGEDATSTAGQIIDNFTDGRVQVWWVDGHISMSWPQDLFEVGQYDHADWGHESEDSWETESENSEFGGSSSPKLSISESHILSNIERARVAIARLEEIFNISPNSQSPQVMLTLLTIYKSCRYFDRLLNTTFFHEDNFMGLIERVRKGGSQSVSERALVCKNRLFSDTQITSPNSKQSQQSHQHQQCHFHAIVSLNGPQKLQNSTSNTSNKEYSPKVLLNISSTPFKFTPSTCSMSSFNGGVGATGNASSACKRKSSTATVVKSETNISGNISEVPANVSCATITPKRDAHVSLPLTNALESSSNKQNPYNSEKTDLLCSAMVNIEEALEKTSQLEFAMTSAASQDDSGNFSRNENCDGRSTSYASSSDLTNVDANSSLTKVNNDQKSVSCSSIELAEDASPELLCVRLCSVLKDQLVKCINEIREKYYKGDGLNLSDAAADNDAEDYTSETVVEVSDIHANADAEEVRNSPVLSKIDAPTDEPSTIVSSPTLTTHAPAVFLVPAECFQVLSNAPKSHKFYLTIFHPNNSQQYYKAVQREHRMLKSSLPPGVWVRVFEDRMDLLSVMIAGPKNTPYEDGMFFFDIQLGREYPKSPPLCHYITYCSDRLNPNLYEDGKVCVSLLGTWSGRDSEVWGPNSTLLQVIVSIQGLILVPEPYYNEAGYDKQKGTQQGKDNSRMYNEMVIIKMVQATTKLLQQSPEIFREEILKHYKLSGQSMHERIRGWMELSKIIPIASNEGIVSDDDVKNGTEAQQMAGNPTATTNCYKLPEFSLVPASRGFCITLVGLLDTLKSKLQNLSTETDASCSSVPGLDTAVATDTAVIIKEE